jgi:hypothetical protein
MGAGARGAGRRPCRRPCGVCDQRKTSLVAHVRPSRILHRPVPAALAQGPKNPGILVALTSLLADGPVFLFRNIALRFRKVRSVPGQGLSV